MDGVQIFVENSQSGARPTNKVPVNGRSQTFAAMFGDGIKGTSIGVNGQAPSNVKIMFGPPNGQSQQLNNNGNPSKVGNNGQPVDISQWTIGAQQA